MTRQEAMALLARANTAELQAAWDRLTPAPRPEPLRGPETGMMMLRGRAGGGGAPFNLGEATVARATVRLEGGEIGFSCVLGRDLEKARLAAVFDALWQRGADRAGLEATLLVPLAERLAADDRRRAEEVAATRVNFFTMTRGEDA